MLKITPSSGASWKSPPTLPLPAEIQSLVRGQRQTALDMAALGASGVVACFALVAAHVEVLGLVALMLGGSSLGSCCGRLWALGGWKVERWDWATATLWFIEGAEVETDSDYDAVWYHLKLSPVRPFVGSPTTPQRISTRYLSIRLCPRGLGAHCDWAGRYLVVLEAVDGKRIAYLHGRTRLWRAGGDSPWDWLMD